MSPFDAVEPPTELRFRPSRVEGIEGVKEVAVFRDRIELVTDEELVSIPFADISRPADPRFWPRLLSSIRSLFGHTSLRTVANRDWFHEPHSRYFSFYTSPRIKVCMPVDEGEEYGPSHFFRLRCVLRAGGYETFDLG